MLILQLDTRQNRITVGEATIEFTHRYEVAMLALLVSAGAVCQRSAVDRETVERALAIAGQRTPLNRKQLSRLLDSIESGLQQIPAVMNHSQILTLARKRTTGPWWFVPPRGVQFNDQNGNLHGTGVAKPSTSGATSATESTDAQFCFAQDGSLATTRKILWKIFFADAHAWDGAYAEVATTLDDDEPWNGATPAARIHRHLRLTRAYGALREFDEADKHVREAGRIANKSTALSAFFGSTIGLMQERIKYDRNPIQAAKSVVDSINLQIADTFQRNDGTLGKPAVNPTALGRAFTLRGLARRRMIESLPASADAATIEPLVRSCISDSVAAVFCLLATMDLETTQSLVINAAYNLQQIALRGWLPTSSENEADDEVFGWYRFAFAYHHRFHLPDNRVWEYIFLGEFWLATATRVDNKSLVASKVARETSFDWQGANPSQVGFYIFALEHAMPLGDPRQIAYAALNLYRFSKLNHLDVQASGALKVLNDVARVRPDVIALLRREVGGDQLPTFMG